MTIDEIFHTIKNHMLTQNAPATNGGPCIYRDAQGRKCAVGALIPDALYSPDIEGRGVWEIRATLRAAGIPLTTCDAADRVYQLLDRAQGIHDAHSTERWAAALDALATDLGIVGQST